MSAHVPGPYVVDLDDLKDHDLGCDVVIEAHGAAIATVHGFGGSPCFDVDDEQHDLPSLHQETIDTALLMAAAPDLLAACERVLKEYEAWRDDDSSLFFSDGLIESINGPVADAVKKARGK